MSKKRKKFRETKIGQFLLGRSGVFQTLAETIPDKGLLGLVKDLVIKDSDLPQQDKDIALKMLDMDLAEMDSVTRRWESDNLSDSYLSKNIRPLSLIFLTLVFAVGFFMEYDLTLITQLLFVIYGAYFGGRSIEKIRKL
jgi:hypothetical protein|tara:strand:- start:2565 stop:2981 length:417 start_codon:yes stop_codon:yes gene_type:complete